MIERVLIDGKWITAKFCPGCKKYLHVSGFRKRKDRTDGLSDYCKGCEQWKRRAKSAVFNWKGIRTRREQ